jgi:hypothetical protein
MRTALGKTDQLAGVSSELAAIRGALDRGSAKNGDGAHAGELVSVLARLEGALQKVAQPQLHVRVENVAPPGVDELLAQQIAIIERTLVPLVRTTNQQLVSPTKVDEKVAELLGLLREVDARLRAGQPAIPGRIAMPAAPRPAAANPASRPIAAPGVPSFVPPEPSPPPVPASSPSITGTREPWRPPPQFRPPPIPGSDEPAGE